MTAAVEMAVLKAAVFAAVTFASMIGVNVTTLMGADTSSAAAPSSAMPHSQLPEFRDVTATHLPRQALVGRSMDAEAVDVDGDGDLDLVVAKEFGPNVLLINDGSGRFRNESAARLPQPSHDTEDIAAADFDGDGDPDLVFVSEDDFVNEYYWNDGRGHFTAAPADWLPASGESNVVTVHDLDGGGDPDLVIGNAGQDVVLMNDGAGKFVDESAARLGADSSRSQDLQFADVDGDGDADLVQANEDGNRLLINDGMGNFADETATRLPLPPLGEETRQAALTDVDGDADLDLYFANVRFGFERNPQDRLLLNDGAGTFRDVTAGHLPAESYSTVDARFADLDDDGDPDLLRANAFGGGFEAWANDGWGVFEDVTAEVLPGGLGGDGIDIVVADLDGDGQQDLYLCNYQTADRLLLGPLPGTTLHLPVAFQPSGSLATMLASTLPHPQ